MRLTVQRPRTYLRQDQKLELCVPEEVRKGADSMPIYPFEAPVFPRRYPSPFLTGGRSTGGLGESVEKA